MQILLGIIIVAVWLYILHVLTKAKLHAWRFIWGSLGLFIIMMIYVRPVLTFPLAQGISAIAGFVGQITNTFVPYFKYGTIFVETTTCAITLQIDFECSGVLEIMAFLSLLLFFNVYTRYEKVMVSVVGTVYLCLANVLRIILICEIIHFGGSKYYYIAHTYLGRIFFYILTILLYFNVFTKPQVIKMKVGDFSYDADK